MNKDELEKLRYPIGTLKISGNYSPAKLQEFILNLEAFPVQMESAVIGLNDNQLDTPYRAGGWTIRQVVHHCADSHANAFIRFKLALTEEQPTIKPYREALWAELPDSKMPVVHSLFVLKGLHARWAALCRSMSDKQVQCRYYHPESKRIFSLEEAMELYDWHCRHHLAHISGLIEREGWVKPDR